MSSKGSSPRLLGSCRGTPGIELPTAHERYRAVLPTCHGQNPDSFQSFVSADFCEPNRDVPDPKKFSEHFLPEGTQISSNF